MNKSIQKITNAYFNFIFTKCDWLKSLPGSVTSRQSEQRGRADTEFTYAALYGKHSRVL